MKGFAALSTVAKVAESVRGLDFPQSKKDIIEYARDHNAPDQVITVLEKVPDQVYESLDSLMHKAREVV